MIYYISTYAVQNTYSFIFWKTSFNIYLVFLHIYKVSVPMRSKGKCYDHTKKKKFRGWILDSELRNWGLKFKEPSVLKLLRQIWTNSKMFSIECYFELRFTGPLNHVFLLFFHPVSCDSCYMQIRTYCPPTWGSDIHSTYCVVL